MLTLASFCIITCFELLNKRYGADLGIHEFRMLYTMWKSVNPHSFFQSRARVRWPAYISDLPRHDKYWYKDVLVVEVEWEVTFLGPEFEIFPSSVFRYNSDLEGIVSAILS